MVPSCTPLAGIANTPSAWGSLPPMNILLTGGLGYIGSHTAVVLAQAGHRVVLLDNLSNSRADVAIESRPVDFT